MNIKWLMVFLCACCLCLTIWVIDPFKKQFETECWMPLQSPVGYVILNKCTGQTKNHVVPQVEAMYKQMNELRKNGM